MRTMLLALLGASATLAASSASAEVLYDNGPAKGTINAYTISGSYAVANTFTLAADATVTGITLTAWEDIGDHLQAVDWGISTWDDYAIDGTAAATSTGFFASGVLGIYDVESYRLSFAPVALSAGTYYLSLQNAVSAGGSFVYWDESDGPSKAYQSSPQFGELDLTSHSETFQVLGTMSATPEPESWALMLGGFGLVGGALRRRTRPRLA